MSEMLGNQYFLARKYIQASREYENALKENPGDKSLRRKLIVCYTQIGQISRALAMFKCLVNEDIDFIIETASTDEECPCPDIIQDMETKLDENESSQDFYLILGMLWLYCDMSKAQKYFKIARQFEYNQEMIDHILNRIEKKLKTKNVTDSKRQSVSSGNSNLLH